MEEGINLAGRAIIMMIKNTSAGDKPLACIVYAGKDIKEAE